MRGKPSQEELAEKLREHVNKIRELGLVGPKLGELKTVCLESEFEEPSA
ncbi:MAG: hypothetical protein QW179_00695 [Candidatus Hadarchaeales archaeon]